MPNMSNLSKHGMKVKTWDAH